MHSDLFSASRSARKDGKPIVMSLKIVAIFALVGILSLCCGVNAKLKGDDCEGMNILNVLLQA